MRAREHRQTLLASADLADEAAYADFLFPVEEERYLDRCFNLEGEIESLEAALTRKRTALSDLKLKWEEDNHGKLK